MSQLTKVIISLVSFFPISRCFSSKAILSPFILTKYQSKPSFRSSLRGINDWREVVLTNLPDDDYIKLLKLRRPKIEVFKVENDTATFWAYWSLHSIDSKLQIDGTQLEQYFLGSKPFTVLETVEQWNTVLSGRKKFNQKELDLSGRVLFSTYEGRFQNELNSCIRAVTLASQVTRSLQKKFQFAGEGSLKEDDSPVTIADFSAQALIIDWLSQQYPDDKFIAEEDSGVIKSDDDVRKRVIQVLESVTGDQWSTERLCETVDKGSFCPDIETKRGSRVWVLDPVDGTKGFVRGMHFCVALSLMVDGRPVLSVLGCPNLQLKPLLQGAATSEIAAILPRLSLPYDAPCAQVHHPDSGSIFFCVEGGGAYCRSLSMDLGAAFECQVSGKSLASLPDAVLCEAVETSFGDMGTTARVAADLGLRGDFLRLHGQCKYCAVAAGGADGNLRVNKPNYVEKIWDHAPGYLLVTEAGGRVTDGQGRELDFGQGRYLAADVRAIVASNGPLHNRILTALTHAGRQ